MDDAVGSTYMVHDFGVASPVWYWDARLPQIAELERRVRNLEAERAALEVRCQRLTLALERK
jgi:hypothetical protein